MKLQLPQCPWALVICFFAVISSAAQQISAPEPQSGTIVGTVVDDTGAVVPGATILLQGQTPDDERRAVTLDNGFFKMDGVKPATRYHVAVSAAGFAQWTSTEIVLTPSQYLILTGINLRVASVQTTVNVVPTEELGVQQLKAEEQQRIVGVIPNFYVAYDQDAAPLTAKMKFHLATKFLTDPVTTAGFAFNAATYQMGGYPSYQQGAKGYGERLGATFAGGYTNILVGDALLPSLLHQDPRYFYQGTGTTKSRLLHALSSPFVIRGDDGRREINLSDIGGDLASGAIANAYYPEKDRGANLVLSSALIGAGGRAANAIFQEFVLHKFTSRHSKDSH
ncbi:MAG TPA: carboxypeptidase-like regulatory domain-containing protein [Terriglobales bacterium]|nr:carboxypeptidase-like regulatory domain-containing protein [Terriglobales bacterium]